MSRRRTLTRARSLRAERDEAELTAAKSERMSGEPRSVTSLPEQRKPMTLAGEIAQLHRQFGNSALRRIASKDSFVAPTRVEAILRQEHGRGQPLDNTVRGQMEPVVGADLGGVRIHTDEQAAELSAELTAKAFTHGRDIYFGSGEYAPGSEGGQRVLAHELAHVAQQRSGAKLVVGSAYDPAEQEADQVADRAVRSIHSEKARAGGEVHRQVAEEEEEELQPARRQVEEEEEEAMAVRRQEEEELAQPVRRQDEQEEEEALAIRRQGDEEEEQQPTTSTQPAATEEASTAQAPTSSTQSPASDQASTAATQALTTEQPATAQAPTTEQAPDSATQPSAGRAGAVVALWNSAVVSPVRQASEILGGSGSARSRAQRATDLIVGGRQSIRDMRENYRDQPETFGRLVFGGERLNTLVAALSPYLDQRLSLSEAGSMLSDIVPMLQETGERL